MHVKILANYFYRLPDVIAMTENKIKCPICGKMNEPNAETCKMCKTHLSPNDKGSVSVKSPKSRGKTITIVDIEDPLTRKRLEELTLIPGVNRKKALLLYQSGIHSMDDFLQKAFHGERMSANYSRTVANKLLVRSLKNKKVKTDIPCPSCNAANPVDVERCHVCNFDIKKEMESVNLSKISTQLSESVTGILASLNESEDFEALPDEMKAQIASLVDSDDIDFDMDKPKELENLGIDIETIDEEETENKAKNVSQSQQSTTDEKTVLIPGAGIPSPDSPQKTDVSVKKIPSKDSAALKEQKPAKIPESAAPSGKQEKIRKVLTEKMDQWRKSGYDVSGLEQYLEDVEGFKVKAKEILGNGKVVKIKYAKQVEMWKEKGFDISELEPLLETDLDAFMEKAKDILKKQKKK
jgi:ribosomal protein L40E